MAMKTNWRSKAKLERKSRPTSLCSSMMPHCTNMATVTITPNKATRPTLRQRTCCCFVKSPSGGLQQQHWRRHR